MRASVAATKARFGAKFVLRIWATAGAMFRILRFIVRENSPHSVPFACVRALAWQIFKRISGAVISKKIFNGKSIFLFPNCQISSAFVYAKLPDAREIRALREGILDSPNAIFLDIGANVGSYCVALCDLLPPANILAFEPHPLSNKRARLNFLLNNLDESRVLPLALSDKCGEVAFENSTTSLSTNKIAAASVPGAIKVQATTLDSFAQNLPKDAEYFLKIDVEGFERAVFNWGGGAFFKNYRVKMVVFECFDLDESLRETLKNLGFGEVEKLSPNNYKMEKK